MDIVGRGTPPNALRPHPERHVIFETRDLDESRQFTSGLWGRRAITAWRPNAPFHTRVAHVPLAETADTCVRQESWIDINQLQQIDFYGLCLVLQGHVTHWVGERELRCGPGDAVIHSPTCASRLRSHGAVRMATARIDRGLLETELSAALGSSLRTPLEFDGPVNAKNAEGARLVRLLRGLLREVDGPDGAAWQASLAARHYERLLAASLLAGATSNYSERLGEPALPAGRNSARLAAEFMEGHLDMPLSIGRIATAVGLSARTLHRTFVREYGVPPMAYLRQARLEKVRQELETADTRTTVTGAALGWGFTHLGRFSLDYATAFGESPSTTLRRVRLAHRMTAERS